MPRLTTHTPKPFVGLLAAAAVLVPTAIIAQTTTTQLPPKPGDATKKKEPPKPTNPILDSQPQKLPLPLPRQDRLGDYRPKDDPERNRAPKAKPEDELPLFGYNHFEPARRAIELRRALYEQYLGGDISLTPRDKKKKATSKDEEESDEKLQGMNAEPRRTLRRPKYTKEDILAVKALTEQQQLDLLKKKRDGKLTAEEKKKYRLFLAPAHPEDLDLNALEEELRKDPVANLTQAQQLELLKRQRDGLLTPEEKRTYYDFLYPEEEEDPDAYIYPNRRDLNRPGGTYRDGRQGSRSSTRPTGSGGFLYGQDNGTRGGTSRFDDRPALTNRLGFDNRMDRTGRTGTTNRNGTARDERDTDRDGTDRTDEDGNLIDPRDRTGRLGFPPSIMRSQNEEELDRLRSMRSLDALAGEVADPIAQLYLNIKASVPQNYQIGGGDKITLRLSSPKLDMQEYPLTVDGTGAVDAPDIGHIVLRGQTLAQAEANLLARYQRQYKGAKVSLSIAELRTMPITVSGESFAPGTYVVPAVASAYNLIYATGGPTDEGSLRRIEVHRNSKLVGTIDYYKYLITGDQATDVHLESGDVIYIPGRQSRVTVNGEVRRPAVFEIADGETLKDALRYAGGVKPSGVSQRVQVNTVQPGASRVLKDVDITGLKSNDPVPVFDGDTVDIFSVRETLTNVVSVEGAVDQPGQYAMTDGGMTVADLLERSRGMLAEAYPTLAHLYRWNPDNTLTLIPVDLEKAMKRDGLGNPALLRWDRLVVYSRAEIAFTGNRDATVRGAVKNPGIYARSDNMKVRDLLIQAGGTIPEAYLETAFLLHNKPDGSHSYDYVNLKAALADDPQHNVIIQDKDVLAIYRTDEARFTPEHVVTVEGEVNRPGKYPRGEGWKLSDVLRVVGGLTDRAGERILVAHARTEETAAPTSVTYNAATASVTPDVQIMDGDVITIQGRGTFQSKPRLVKVEGAVNRPGPVILSGPNMKLSEVIKEAGGLKPEAFPEGAEFIRDPMLLTTDKQKEIAVLINKLNDTLNQSSVTSMRAVAKIEGIRAVGAAAKSTPGLNIPGFTTAPETATPGLEKGTESLFKDDLVSPPRNLTAEDLAPNGNVAVNLKEAVAKPGSPDDFVMLDGDTITIPVRPTTVQVIGAVYHPRGVLFRDGSGADYYLDQAGGYALDAAKDRVQVIRAGGGLTPLKKVGKFQPGDVILVPTAPQAAKIEQKRDTIGDIFKGITNTSLVLLVAKKLVGF
jgi:protein involved in polysaccharide export with SLBB domain